MKPLTKHTVRKKYQIWNGINTIYGPVLSVSVDHFCTVTWRVFFSFQHEELVKEVLEECVMEYFEGVEKKIQYGNTKTIPQKAI